MKKRLFLYTILIIFAGLAGFFAASVYITYTNNFNIAKNSVMEITHICAGLYGDSVDISSFVQAGNDTRITVISPDGTVTADSRPLDLGAVENHLSRPQRGGGTELGLSIVKHICALYGWNLSLKSKLGVGTEITVVFT